MFTEEQTRKLLSVLTRIADALESLACAVDEEENELNVYVHGEVSTEGEEEEEEEEEEVETY